MERIWLIFTLMLLTLPAQAAIEMYYLHNDHLGTPRVVTNQQKEIVWKGHLKPFGEMEVEVAAITNHRRFPGQRFDIESRLYYNYFRDYDPSLGRYIQSDPIGLDGGLNTYAYVGGNPINFVDLYGLDATKIINTTGGRDIWDGPTNGNWGGKCWSGGQYSCGANGIGRAQATDSGDQCYKDHDQCYADCTTTHCIARCDAGLVRGLMKLDDDPIAWPIPPTPGTENDTRRYRDWALRFFN